MSEAKQNIFQKIKVPDHIQQNPYYKIRQIRIIFTMFGCIVFDKGLLIIANFAIAISYYYFNGIEGIVKQFINTDNKIALFLYLFSLYCMIKGMITSGLILELISGMVLFKPLRFVIISGIKIIWSLIRKL